MEIALSLEREITKREEKLFELTIQIQSFTNKTNVEADRKKIFEEFQYQQKIYADAVDKLCLAILNKYIEGRLWRREYKAIISDIRDMLGAGITKNEYPNIHALHTKWSSR